MTQKNNQTYPIQQIVLNKRVGKTPLETLEEWRSNNPEYRTAKMAYAGRLDPMAEGKLIVLIGDECKERDHYLHLDKEYEFEVLLGVSSDTYDILGLVQAQDGCEVVERDVKMKTVVAQLSALRTLPYPAYSSKTVGGKPLFLWALEGRLGEIEIPNKDVAIYTLEVLDTYTLSQREVMDQVRARIGEVTKVVEHSKELGRDFRRKEVLASWDQVESLNTTHVYQVVKLRCVCSSGTYMRTLADMLGSRLGCGGVAWSITRTRIGTYRKIFGRWGVWTKEYV